MKVTVFAKNKQTTDGKKFIIYIARLTKKDGSEISVRVYFNEASGRPNKDECPMTIEINKKDANLSTETYTREDTGEEAVAYKLWVNAWKKAKEEFVDHSLDDFE